MFGRCGIRVAVRSVSYLDEEAADGTGLGYLDVDR
jgi:hypothetical protein